MLTISDDKLVVEFPHVAYELELQDDVVLARKIRGRYECRCGGEFFPHQCGSLHAVFKGWAFDISFKCRDCHFYVVHGIPCEKDERLRKFATKFIINEDEEIKRRLEKLGYW